MTAGWPPLGGDWGRWEDKLPRLDHPVVSANANTPASPRLASLSARKCFRIAPVHSVCHAMSGFPVHQAVTNKENQTSGTPWRKRKPKFQ